MPSPVIFLVLRAGGLDDTLHTIIDYACDQNIPFVFALNRKALGRSLNKAVPVSVVGIFSYDGAQVSRGCWPVLLWEGVKGDGGCLHFTGRVALSPWGPSLKSGSLGGLVSLKTQKCESSFALGSLVSQRSLRKA